MMTRKITFYCGCAFLMVGCWFSSRVDAESTLQLVQGNVEEVDRSEHQLTISVLDQKTGLTQIFQVQINVATKFVKMNNLKDIKPGDIVNVDFSQGQKGAFVASRLELVESVQKADDKKKSSPGEDRKTENGNTLF